MPHDGMLRWTCHSCGKEIDDMARAIIVKNFIYHDSHSPSSKTPKKKETDGQ